MWRRDPTLFSRTPIRRSSATVVRSKRCFSKTRAIYARYNDEAESNDSKKPKGMSDVDWMREMRQRHYRRWKKRIEENPYRALFGASEDMLQGKGLEGYLARQVEQRNRRRELMEKALPKWMLEDFGYFEANKSKGNEGESPSKEEGYPKRVKIDAEEETESQRQGRPSRQPRPRSGEFEKQGNEGVESPSDPRRLREQPVNVLRDESALREDIVHSLHKDMSASPAPTQQSDVPAQAQEASQEPMTKSWDTVQGEVQSREDAAARETSFIEEFLTTDNPSGLPTRSENTSKDWRKTSLERRAASGVALRSRRKTDVPVVDVSARDEARQKRDDSSELRATQRTDAEMNSNTNFRRDTETKARVHSSPASGSGKVIVNFHGPSDSRVGMREVEEFAAMVNETQVRQEPQEPSNNSTESKNTTESHSQHWPWLPADGTHEAVLETPTIEDVQDVNSERSKHDPPAASRRSTSVILEQLPKDDIDFLSADDIRASMGRMKGVQEDKSAVRRKLEEDYQKETAQLHPMVEAQVLNNQYIRRKTGEISHAQGPTKPIEAAPTSVIPEEIENTNPTSVLETSLDLMSKWLHTGGNVFAQHFWQDPVQLGAGQVSAKDEAFLKGIGIGILKGRSAFALIKDELVEDVPAAKKLVTRLSADEVRASAGAARLYRELPSALKDTSDTAASNVAARMRVGKLKQALWDTEKQLKEACETIAKIEGNKQPSFLLAKRLKFAAEVLHKNAQLTRVSILKLQGRIEVASGSEGVIFRELLHRLLTLQDTQLALSKVVSTTMQVMGINSTTEEIGAKSDESAAILANPPTIDTVASAVSTDGSAQQSIDSAAANQKLDEEISRQKAAMRGLSDDGYKHPPKPLIRRSFDGPNPLAHSLFRPFSLQLDSLGKEADVEEESTISAAKKKEGDRVLVKEVKKAYEDVYGEINVDHRQISPEQEQNLTSENPTTVLEAEISEEQIPIQMLKEDNVSPQITSEVSKTRADVQTFENEARMNETISEVIPASEVGAIETPVVVENMQPLDALNKRARTLSENESLPVETESSWTDGIPIAESKGEQATLASSETAGKELAYDPSTDEYVPISYKTFVYNAEKDKLSIATSQVPQPSPSISPIPLHEALTTLSHPAKFIEHLPPAFHVIAVKPDILTVRTASPSSPTAEKTLTPALDAQPPDSALATDEPDGWNRINPVDGTTTLSPTGFEGVGSDLERELEFQERRRQAAEYNRELNHVRKNFEAAAKKKHNDTDDASAGKKRGRGGGVVKTAIWAATFCYVVGVAAEVAKG